MGTLKVTKSKDGIILEEIETDTLENKGGKVAKRKSKQKVSKHKEASS